VRLVTGALCSDRELPFGHAEDTINPMTDLLEKTAATLPCTYAGPGGAIAVLREGTVVLRHSWGWANAERRIPFTPRTLFRMCSITKQFTCAALLDAFRDPAALDEDVGAKLPLLEQPPPGILHLCHNQSGLRDYWALAMLHGSPVEAPFGEEDAARIIRGTKKLQFTPGTRFSYVNQNFRLLADILCDRESRDFAEVLRARIFDRANMTAAFVAADTTAMPDGTVGYEGSSSGGFRTAENRILWTGDAGLGACLDDMIAWEKYIDATRDDPDALYRRLSAKVTFADGTAAGYGFGLGRSNEFGRAVTGHGGALRGWRSHRLYAHEERVSVVVMFNHMADARAAALSLLAAALSIGDPKPDAGTTAAPSELAGVYLEPETRLAVRVDAGTGKLLNLRYGHNAEQLEVDEHGSAVNTHGVRLRRGEGGLWMDRPGENQSSILQPLEGTSLGGLAGRYRCDELDAEITVAASGGVPYGALSGFLGRGRMEMLEHVGADVWTLPCPRALDHTPPGDWTLAFIRNPSGTVTGIELGCWLARHLMYRRID
jgi:D-aminopeptidase